MKLVFLGFVIGAVWFWHEKPEYKPELITEADRAQLQRVLDSLD